MKNLGVQKEKEFDWKMNERNDGVEDKKILES